MMLRSCPLACCRDESFYGVRTEARDRFGTRREHRFTRPEMEQMLRAAGPRDIRFFGRRPFGSALGTTR